MTKLPAGFLKHPAHFLAFGFGSGCTPKAPGTFGTLVGMMVYCLLPPMSMPLFLGFILVSFFLGIYFCDKATKALGVHDHGGIVWDEFVGFWISVIALPEGLAWLLLAFCLFRLFDIWKPQPIKYLDQKVEGGLGIMLDDVVAGIYALIVVQAIHFML
ncbi:MAG: phosphatidylglycerophosphatase A [Oleiphilus sp.]